ncbi:hypothetical protein BSL78_18062 [Apostichopus japonicus]|uniref:Uncharacterized protein n=1 Tax=Stichopus japonicus TaxID=307972 RepID=A0A2G8KAS9_STIJA|nr:hypothetical protein BSL78_18062 [Apostichopus japonicus]
MAGLSQSHGEYAALLKKRFDHLSRVMLVLQKKQQDAQNVKISAKLDKGAIYSTGQLVYLYKPTSSSLTANSRKIAAEWCGPLVIHQVLDRTHYLLATLKGEILSDVFNYNRLKPCFVRASSETKNITNIQKLRQVLKTKGSSSEKVARMRNVLSSNTSNAENVNVMQDAHIEFHDEFGNILPGVTSDHHVSYDTKPMNVASFLENRAHNEGLAIPYPSIKIAY